MWSVHEIAFVLDDDQCEGPVATIEVHTPDGLLLIMGEPRIEGRRLVAVGVHMHGIGLGPNGVGAANLRVIADAFLEGLGYDEIVVERGVRTSGAKPGRRPRAVRFTRRPGHSAA